MKKLLVAHGTAMTVTYSFARKRFDTALLSSADGASTSSRHDIPEHISGNEAKVNTNLTGLMPKEQQHHTHFKFKNINKDFDAA